jgi:hypothetical protein
MVHDLIKEKSYRELTSKQLKQLLNYVKGQNVSFNITANIKGIDFNPELPEHISKSFSQFTLFTLANYTLESLVIEEDHVSFEAGFGHENFGSVCWIPYYAILQVSIEDSILFINPSATVESNYEENKENQKEKSMNAFKTMS